jgi:hypothetical protein
MHQSYPCLEEKAGERKPSTPRLQYPDCYYCKRVRYTALITVLYTSCRV